MFRREGRNGDQTALGTIAEAIERHVPDTRAVLRHAQGTVTGVNVTADEAQIKIEANLVLRGTVHPPVQRDLCKAAADRFEMFVSAQTVPLEDLYGGKICAALDRQHPRDLYDVHVLLENEGLTAACEQEITVKMPGQSFLRQGFCQSRHYRSASPFRANQRTSAAQRCFQTANYRRHLREAGNVKCAKRDPVASDLLALAQDPGRQRDRRICDDMIR